MFKLDKIAPVILLIASVSYSHFAVAEFPAFPGQDTWENKPNDPGYKNQWQLYSHLPKEHRNPNLSDFDRKNGSGMGVDKAWQLHLGNARMLVSIHDSGIDWKRKDLVNNIYLNAAELPPPEGFNHHDINNDGRLNVKDYTHDSRVGDKNNNGLIDPEDLILSFSDGVDSDGNGYVDDISGWDFVENDNNPADRIQYNHGTNQGLDSVAEINNGIGGAGICGQCAVMFVRTGDTYIIDSNAFAKSVVFATNSGVKVVQAALGGLNNSPFVRDAVNYAYDKDVVVVGTAADEASYHNNQPAMYDPVLYPNAIRYDNYKPEDATTFVNFNNCSNYGPRLDVAVAALHCSSEATANLSGIVALVRSFSESLSKPLSVGELISLVKSSATDVNFGSNQSDSSRFSTYEGWDDVTGFGRVDAWQMMLAIRNKDIPPEARITSPNWFDVFRVRDTATIPVNIKIGQPRFHAYSAEVSVARGVNTAKQKFISLATIPDVSKGFEGEIASLNVADLMKLPVSTIDHHRYHNAFTIRISLTGSNGRTVVTRRTIYVFDDDELHSGFPYDMNGSGESTGLFFDLDADGRDEYVTVDGAGYVYAFSHTQGLLAGFPAKIGNSRYREQGMSEAVAVVGPIAAGDIDLDGKGEIAVATFEGHVAIVRADGSFQTGFPKRLEPIRLTEAKKDQRLLPGILAAPTLANVYDDDNLEVIVTTLDGHLYVFDKDANVVPGFPFEVRIAAKRAKIVSSPAIADLNNDGFKDIIFGTNHFGPLSGQIFAVDGQSIDSGSPDYLPGFPARIPMVRDQLLPTIGVGISMSPAVADIDNDGKLEVLAHGVMGKMYAIADDGSIEHIFSAKVGGQTKVNDSFMITGIGHPAVGRLVKGSTTLNPVGVGVGKKILTSIILGGVRYPYDHMITAWDVKSGDMLSGLPIPTDDMMIFNTAILIDMDGDKVDELLYASGGNYAHAYKQDGNKYPGFPHFTGGWSASAISAGDFDGDGSVDIGTSTREGFVYIWSTEAKFNYSSMSWPTFQANPQRTGVFNGR